MKTEIAKHTPGPWVVDGNDVIAPYRERELVATAYQIFDESHELKDSPESHANARLIAAAPELLEALREMRDWMADHPETKREKELIAQANVAIAKAEGA